MRATAALILLGIGAATAAPRPLASYRGGGVTAAEHSDWLLAQNLKADPARLGADLEAMALAKTLEAAALAARLEEAPEARFRLEDAERTVLAEALQRREVGGSGVTDAGVDAGLEPAR